MTVRIFFAPDDKDCVVWTNLPQDEAKLLFGVQLGTALFEAGQTLQRSGSSDEKVRRFYGTAIERGLFVYLKALGYKTEEVREERILVCGPATYSDTLIAGQGDGISPYIADRTKSEEPTLVAIMPPPLKNFLGKKEGGAQ